MEEPSHCRTAAFGLLAFAAATGLTAAPAQALQPRFQPGDRVECNSTQSSGGPWDPGTVVQYTDQDRQLDPAVVRSGRYYRVNLDKYPAFLNPVTCMADFIRPGGGASATAGDASDPGGRAGAGDRPAPQPSLAAPRPAAPPQPRPQGAGDPAPRDLRGTAWKIESPGSVGVQVFLFCNSGRWEIVGSQLLNGIVSPVGNYQQAGSSLTTRNADDGKVEKWSLQWPGGDVLEMTDSRTRKRLHYNGRTSC